MPVSPRARFLLAASVVFFATALGVAGGEPASRVWQVPSKPGSAASSQIPQAKNSVAGPPAPVSTHFPILLLVVGKDLSWSLRIGQKGPERYDRNGYPPIPLDPGTVVQEAHTETWTYNAKDMQTGAAVTIHLSRVPCTDNSTAMKYGFTASVDDAQIGSADGCARIATDLFPRINNQLNDDTDDSTDDNADTAKDKPVPTTVTRFTPPTAVAYITDTGRMVVKRGSYSRAVAGPAGHDLCLSHDGKKLLFVRDEEASPMRTLEEFDFETRKITELVKANLREPFWSPDDSRIAFLENTNNKWQVWIMPADAPDKATALATSDITTLDGWADSHTLLTDDLQSLSWIGDDGTVRQTLSSSLLYGKDQFGLSSANTVRVHPSNPDLLLVSAELTAPLPPAVPDPTRKDAPKTDSSHPGMAFFLYEIRSRRRVFLSPPNLTSSLAEWSSDGLQIFFTGSATSSSAPAIYRLFWDGAGQIKIHDGRDYVIGQ